MYVLKKCENGKFIINKMDSEVKRLDWYMKFIVSYSRRVIAAIKITQEFKNNVLSNC